MIAFATTMPHFAEARAGGGRSTGSRGTRTYQPSPNYNAAPINRSASTRQNAQPNNPQPSSAQSQAPVNNGHPFLRSIAGGFLGAGLFGMLAGHGGMGDGSSGGGMIGGLLQFLLIGGIGYYLYKRFVRPASSSNNTMNPVTMDATPINDATYDTVKQLPSSSSTISITDEDKDSFEQLLLQIQTAWSQGDLNKLRQLVTPEMIQYFSEELSANASRGLANKVEQVQLREADIVEAWSENDLDYATAKLQWSALDTMVKLDRKPTDPDYIASGSPITPEDVVEAWTFVRASKGRWLLSAIEQIG